MGWVCLVVVESAQMNDETNVCHTGHQNSSGLEQARVGKHVGLVTLVRTIMSLLFTCNRSSQRSVSTVVLIKHKHLPMVSGTWHFPARSMCTDSVCCTHTHTHSAWGFWKASSHTATRCGPLRPTSLVCRRFTAQWRIFCRVWARSVQSFQEALSCGHQKWLGFSGVMEVRSVDFL